MLVGMGPAGWIVRVPASPSTHGHGDHDRGRSERAHHAEAYELVPTVSRLQLHLCRGGSPHPLLVGGTEGLPQPVVNR